MADRIDEQTGFLEVTTDCGTCHCFAVCTSVEVSGKRAWVIWQDGCPAYAFVRVGQKPDPQTKWFRVYREAEMMIGN
jgi:hypothetical protein